MNISKLIVALFAAAGLSLAGGLSAQTMSKDARDQAIKNAEAQYKTDKAACDALAPHQLSERFSQLFSELPLSCRLRKRSRISGP